MVTHLFQNDGKAASVTPVYKQVSTQPFRTLVLNYQSHAPVRESVYAGGRDHPLIHNAPEEERTEELLTIYGIEILPWMPLIEENS